ncbi:GntR family transcriptional regulator [Streptomyces sp. CCM_MD2014]|uniref:GntR family transcriptional regulator n=1 Tax=Streptomyces sp. CCM_MD2014 TaxID=1561022 RepID=UPI00052A8ED9|nr:GntR family transcriptional regulator [Streptomyces sp. CCM_MD2014]AIV35574.1 hypothetical protein NI25_20430 [Streptomyces sp. CCM_MD2014]
MTEAQAGGRRSLTAPEPRPGLSALYRFLNTGGETLYVGVTDNPPRRWKQHQERAALTWWPLAQHVTVKWFASRKAALDTELRIIRTQRPLYNVGGAPSPRRELAAGERLCPMRTLEHFDRAVGGRWSGGGRHMTECIADVLQEDVQEGHLLPGQRLPTLGALEQRFGVTVGTIRRTLVLLVQHGVIERRGTGSATRYFVAE